MIDRHVQDVGKGEVTSSTLLAEVKARAPEAWQRFVSLYRPLVRYWCQQAGLQTADSEDVAQEVFSAVAGAVDRFQHGQAGNTFRGWLRTITRNAIVNYVRRTRREASGVGGSSALRMIQDIPATPPDSNAGADREETRVLIRQAFELVLAKYKDHTREAFWRVVVEKQKPEDVAQDLGVAVHVVYLAKSRVLRRLQEEFDGLVDLESELEGHPNPGTEP